MWNQRIFSRGILNDDFARGEGMKKKILYVFIIVVFIFGVYFIDNQNDVVVDDEYWKSIHYFANGWPKNMWDSEFETVDGDFKRIKADGFNSVVILVPWREFQPLGEEEYNATALEKLDWLFKKAEENDLGIILRLGYFWDYYNDENDELYDRYEGVLANNGYKGHWLDYSKTIHDIAKQNENYLGAFICWEDFWGVVHKAQNYAGKSEESCLYADFLGYDEYILNEYPSGELTKYIDDIMLEDRICIPDLQSPAFETFYSFIDYKLNILLNETQEVFDGLSMEVRVDDDLVKNEDGDNTWYSHKATYNCGAADYTTIVYGIPMGFENKGEKLTVSAAVSMMDVILKKVYENNNNKKLFVDQFLFYDNTQGFEHNAQIQSNQVNQYLHNCSEILLKYTKGYGIWTYKDYYFDAISNGEFAKELTNWDASAGVVVENISGSNQCVLRNGGSIRQWIGGKSETNAEKTTCSFDVKLLGGKSEITVSLNGVTQSFLAENTNHYILEFETNLDGVFEITSENDVCVDNIKVYNFCQNGMLYDPYWNEQQHIDNIRDLNKMLN